MKLHFLSIRRFRGLSGVLALALAVAHTAAAQSNACDLDGSGAVNTADVNQAVLMALGTTPCTASVENIRTCTIVTVQRIVNSALGQPCVVYNATTRTVGLSWLQSPSTGVTGYNVYRRTTPTGAPVKLNSAQIAGTGFTDTTIQLGQTYYYSATSVGGGMESAESTQATATIPTTN
jgi:hypothetical protein